MTSCKKSPGRDGEGNNTRRFVISCPRLTKMIDILFQSNNKLLGILLLLHQRPAKRRTELRVETTTIIE
jgi:hypothetical protein